MQKITSFLKGSVLIALGGALYVTAAHAAQPVQARVDQQNALFEEQYQSDLERRPERATAVGDFRYNDRLNDYSLAFTQKQHEIDEGFRKRLPAIPTGGFSEPESLLPDPLLRAPKAR